MRSTSNLHPLIVAIGGFSSEVGKTTLLCDLLPVFQGWEAIKVTRGHYRSCGKDPQSCCVSGLLSDKPLIRSGYVQTFSAGKDTGRFWEAGAANVHWLIATDSQIEEGIKQALDKVTGPGVFVEGNSFTEFVAIDFMIMVAPAAGGKIKASARKALTKSSSFFLSNLAKGALPTDPRLETDDDCKATKLSFAAWCEKGLLREKGRDLPIYVQQDLPRLVSEIRRRCMAAPR